jgi:MFS family permease
MNGYATHLVRQLPILLVVAFSLVMLTYVGYGEALRTYPRFQDGRLAAEGEVVRGSMEQVLAAGVPVHMFAGLDALTGPILRADPGLSSIVVSDGTGKAVFETHPEGAAVARPPPAAAGRTTAPFAVSVDGDARRIILPLHQGTDIVGFVTLTVPQSRVIGPVNERFIPLVPVAAGLVIAFAGVSALMGGMAHQRLARALKLLYIVTFLAMSGVVVGALVDLYSGAIQAKNRDLAALLGARVATVYDLGLDLGDVEGFDKVVDDYRRLNPEINEIALTVAGAIATDTDRGQIGRRWQSSPDHYEYALDIKGTSRENAQVRLTISVPFDVVFWQVVRSVKNFAALFLACSLMSLLFLRLIMAYRQRDEGRLALRAGAGLAPGRAPGPVTALTGPGMALEVIKPVFFLSVFVESLYTSFLPQLMHQSVAAAGLSEGATSLLFMLYFLCFAAVLVPGDRVAEMVGPRPVLLAGTVLATIGAFLLAVAGLDTLLIGVARVACGIGQGLMLIGVQSYILAVADSRQVTRGASIIVTSFNAAMISGAAMGALLAVYIAPSGVFVLSGVVLVGVGLFAVVLVTNPRGDTAAVRRPRLGTMLGAMVRDFGVLLRDGEFMKTMLLVGIPAKGVLTGVVSFALPLILARRGFAQEDIGQVLIFYGSGILLLGELVAGRVDRSGRTTGVLFWGSVISGCALLLVATGCAVLLGGGNAQVVGTALVVGSLLLLGMGHGLIYAPVVTHVANCRVSQVVGSTTAAASYRFLERFGHIGGPLIVGQIMMATHDDALAVGLVGIALVVMALLFLLHLPGRAGLVPDHGDGSVAS